MKNDLEEVNDYLRKANLNVKLELAKYEEVAYLTREEGGITLVGDDGALGIAYLEMLKREYSNEKLQEMEIDLVIFFTDRIFTDYEQDPVYAGPQKNQSLGQAWLHDRYIIYNDVGLVRSETLMHEIIHVFGGHHVEESGSFMTVSSKYFCGANDGNRTIDPKNLKIMQVMVKEYRPRDGIMSISDQGLKIYAQILKKDRKNLDLSTLQSLSNRFANIGDVLSNNNEEKRAVEAYRKAIAVAPRGNTELFLKLATAYKKLGDIKNAFVQIQNANKTRRTRPRPGITAF